MKNLFDGERGKFRDIPDYSEGVDPNYFGFGSSEKINAKVLLTNVGLKSIADDVNEILSRGFNGDVVEIPDIREGEIEEFSNLLSRYDIKRICSINRETHERSYILHVMSREAKY